MLHAFYSLYECNCDMGFEVDGSHHILWQICAQAIEEIVGANGRTELALGLDLSREKSVANDIQKGSRFPNEVELRSVGLNVVKILEGLRFLRGLSQEVSDIVDRPPTIKPNPKLESLGQVSGAVHEYNQAHILNRLTNTNFATG